MTCTHGKRQKDSKGDRLPCAWPQCPDGVLGHFVQVSQTEIWGRAHLWAGMRKSNDVKYVWELAKVGNKWTIGK